MSAGLILEKKVLGQATILSQTGQVIVGSGMAAGKNLHDPMIASATEPETVSRPRPEWNR